MSKVFSLLFLPLIFAIPMPAAGLDEESADRICERFAQFHPGPAATPTDQDRKLVSSGSLTGDIVELITEKKDYGEFRRYCLVTEKCDRELAMLFANGWGVERDYDTAAYFLCRAENLSKDERDGMLGHLEEMRTASHPKDLQYCDFVSNNQGAIECARISEYKQSEALDARIAGMRKGLSAEVAAKLDRLWDAAGSFAENEAGLRGLVENGGGTGMPVAVLSEQSSILEEQAGAIERRNKKRAQGCTDDQLKQADRLLNDAYKTAMATRWEKIPINISEAAGTGALRDAERAWIQYRDTWIDFYQARWKGETDAEELRREIALELTVEQTNKLVGIRQSLDELLRQDP